MIARNSQLYDVLVVGGGPAGLAAAQFLTRGRHSCVVFDSGVYRNTGHEHMHAFPTWDHQNPSDFRLQAKQQLKERYSNFYSYVSANVTGAAKLEDGKLEVTCDDGTSWIGKKLIIATGLKDVFPEIPGYSELWAKSIFHCLICHGYESGLVRNVGILVTEDSKCPSMIQHLARNARQFTSNVTIYCNDFSDVAEYFAGTDFAINQRSVSSLDSHGDGVQVNFSDGTSVVEAFLVHKPHTVQRSHLAQDLGLEVDGEGRIVVAEPMKMTAIPGVFAAGDCSSQIHFVLHAALTGGFAASVAAMQLEGNM